MVYKAHCESDRSDRSMSRNATEFAGSEMLGATAMWAVVRRLVLIVGVSGLVAAGCTTDSGVAPTTTVEPVTSSTSVTVPTASATTTSTVLRPETSSTSTTSPGPKWYEALSDPPKLQHVGRPVPRVAYWQDDREGIPAWQTGNTIITADGDVMLVSDTGSPFETYNSRTGFSTNRPSDPRLPPPTPGGLGSTILHNPQWLLSHQSRMATAIEAGHARIVDIDGRPTWRAVDRGPFYTDGCAAYSEDGTCHMVSSVTRWVDVETGLIVKLSSTYNPPLPDSTEYHDDFYTPMTEIEGGMADTDFDAGPDQTIEPSGPRGFVLAPSAGHASLFAGYEVLVPGWIPEGYELTHIAYASGSQGHPRDGEDMVVLVYRNGAWQIEVTTRTIGLVSDWYSEGFWYDPYEPEFYTEEGTILTDETDLLYKGEYRYRIGGRINHAWGLSPNENESGRQLVTVAGAVGRDGLERILASLIPAYASEER